jgi:hypothetical protein
VRGIRTTALWHPVVVIGGSSFEGGPLRVAPGSSSRPDEPGLPILRVSPADVEPVGCLSAPETRFYVLDSERVAVEELGDRLGRLSPAKREELLEVRKWSKG